MAFISVDLVSIRRVVSPAVISLPQRRSGRMTIIPEGVFAPAVVVPYAPREVDHQNIGGEYISVPRPGLPSVVVYQSEQLPTMSFTLFVTDKPDYQTVSPRFSTQVVTTAISVISALKNYASKGYRVRVSYGEFESGLWNITSLGMKSIKRDQYTDEIVQGEVDITFTRASNVVIGVGPLTGGVQPSAPSPAVPSAPTPPSQTSARYYTVKSGDTLWGISIKYYGTGTKWRAIADANGVRDPHLLRIGTVLRIP